MFRPQRYRASLPLRQGLDAEIAVQDAWKHSGIGKPNQVRFGSWADLESPHRLGRLLSNKLTLQSRAFTCAQGH